jgi:monoamine oxidase
MARTPLFTRLQRLYRDFDGHQPTRRDFFKTAAAVAVAARAAGAKPRIAIVGGGIAGLNAARTLQNAGFPSTIYEASSRIGGRMHSDTTTWQNNQYSEHCGELIDSSHTTILQLAQQFGIPIVDVLGSEPLNTTETYFFNGQHYPREQAVSDFAAVYRNVKRDANAAGFATLYNSFKHAGALLDQINVYDWIRGERSRRTWFADGPAA